MFRRTAKWLCFLLVAGTLGLRSSPLRARGVYCKTEDASWIEELRSFGCLAGSSDFFAYSSFSETRDGPNFGVAPLLYAGLYWNPDFSFHSSLRSDWKERGGVEDDSGPEEIRGEAYLAAGHPDKGPLYFSLGRFAEPFGLLTVELPPILPNNHEGSLEPSYESGIRASFQASPKDLVEIASSTNDSKDKLVSTRVSRYLSLLEGTRLVASYRRNMTVQTDTLQLGVLIFGEGGTTLFEWKRYVPSGRNSNQQLFSFFQHFDKLKQGLWIYAQYYSQRHYLVDIGVEHSMLTNMKSFALLRLESYDQFSPNFEKFIYFGFSFNFAVSGPL